MEQTVPRDVQWVYLVVELQAIGPIAKERSAIVRALLRSIAAKRVVWAGTDIRQTAYQIVGVREVVADAAQPAGGAS